MSLTSPMVPEVISGGSDVDALERLLSMAEQAAAAEATSPHQPAPEPDLDPNTDSALSPIAAVIDFVNTSCAQYDGLIEKMGLSPRGSGLPGCLFHWARSTPDGLRIMEVWRNRDSFEPYLAQVMRPAIAGLRLSEPEITVYDVYNYLTAGGTGGQVDELAGG
jgi:hypothetical protein